MSTPASPQLIETEVIEFSLTREAVHVRMPHGMTKSLTIADFIKSLELAESSNEGLPIGVVLPSNVSYFAQNSTTICLNLYYPGGIKTVKFERSGSSGVEELPRTVPNIIISGKFVKQANGEWRLSDSKYFCTDLALHMLPKEFINSVKPAQRIFLLPFTNTYESGNMCFGRNTMPTIFPENSLRAFDWYYQYLFESSFNHDLGLYGVSSLSVTEWFDLLARRATAGEHFPYEHLRGYTPQ